MAKPDDRPLDAGLASLRGSDESRAVQWWKERFGLIAAIPTEAARVGALVPQLRELGRMPEAERRILTRARVRALMELPADQREKIATARKAAYPIDPALLESDDAVVHQVQGEVPGGSAYPGRT